MILRATFAFVTSAGVAACSSSSSPSTKPSPPARFTQVFEAQTSDAPGAGVRSFTNYIIYIESTGTPSIDGTASAAANAPLLDISFGALAAGTYECNDDVIIVTYSADKSAVPGYGGPLSGSSCTIVVTTFDAVHVSGTFSGTLYIANDRTKTPITISNGRFDVARIVADESTGSP